MFARIPGPFGQFAGRVGDIGARARTSMGDAQYNRARSGTSWGLAIGSGFLPITPFLVPIQVVLIIILTIIIFASTSVGFGRSLLYGYLAQAVIVAIAYHSFIDLYMSAGFGV